MIHPLGERAEQKETIYEVLVAAVSQTEDQ